MAKNEYFKRTSKKLKEEDIEVISQGKHKTKFTHFYHKFDGTHVEAHIDKEGVKLITREGNDIAHLVPYIVDDILSNSYWIMYKGIYACELVSLDTFINTPKNTWNQTRKALGVKEYHDDLPKVELVIYDIHKSFETDADLTEFSYAERQMFMPTAETILSNKFAMCTNRIPFSDFVFMPKKIEINKLTSYWQSHIKESKREGFVLFDDTPVDKPCKWEHTFSKVKPAIDVDCVVTGFKYGKTGKNVGRVCTLTVGVYRDGKLHDLGNVSGMKEAEIVMWTERAENEASLFSNPETAYVIQAKATELTVTEKLRFGSYVRERTDKIPSECTFDQLN